MKWQRLCHIFVQLYHMSSDFNIFAAILPYLQQFYHMGSNYTTWQRLSNSLKPIVRPSVRQNHLWARRPSQPSTEARKKLPVGGLNFLVADNSINQFFDKNWPQFVGTCSFCYELAKDWFSNISGSKDNNV